MTSAYRSLPRKIAGTLIVLLAALVPVVVASGASGCWRGPSDTEDGPVGVARSALGTNYCVTHDGSASGCPDGSTDGSPVYDSITAAAEHLQAGDILFIVGGGTPYQEDVVFSNYADAASHDAGDPFASCPLGGVPGQITICGIPDADGGLPVLQGTTNTVTFKDDHYIFQNLEVTSASSTPKDDAGATRRCIFIAADDITLRNVRVHHCPGHGIAAADPDFDNADASGTPLPGAGSVTLDHVEVYSAGYGEEFHPIYMATDEINHLGSVFRMQRCYLHRGGDYLDGGPDGGHTCDDAGDGGFLPDNDDNPPKCVFWGGNMVKSRAERNEIYYNWIEGAQYKELELIAPDWENAPDSGYGDNGDFVPPFVYNDAGELISGPNCNELNWYDSRAREDSDVVGNVIVHSYATHTMITLASDGYFMTCGRYRFVNNTFVFPINYHNYDDQDYMTYMRVFRITNGIDSLEMHNNAFYMADGGPSTSFVMFRGKLSGGRSTAAALSPPTPTRSALLRCLQARVWTRAVI